MPNFARSLAIVIGINNYTNGIPPLQNAVNDAVKLVELLREKYGYQVWEYLDEAATFKNLCEMLETTLPGEVTADDQLLLYFAGHGIALNGDEDDGPKGYLIPQDAQEGNVQTYLPMTQLHDCLNQLPCRHFLGILDCCFAGAFRWSSNKREILAAKTVYKERYDRFISDPAWQVITSAAYDQKALDAFSLNCQRGVEGNHSPFAAALLAALEGQADCYPPATNGKPPGDGVITATELYLYLRDAVELVNESRWQRQTPGIWPLKKHDKGEYIFLPPGHALNLPSAPPLDESKNPYRGLESFEEEHSSLFFGRQKLTQQLYEFVNEQPLTVVLGASGTGKSSLVKAGLIPYLKKLQSQSNKQEWLILAPMRPGESPFRELNNTLSQEKIPVVDLSKINYEQAIKSLSARMNAWCKRNPQLKLLFVVDQLEEVITLCRDEPERENFLNFLAVAVAKYPEHLRIVLTLRSDFEPQFQDNHLQEYWKKARFIMPAMTRDELRAAIEEPASARVMYFEPHDLVDKLIDEVAQMPGALPLLSFTLSELYLKYLKGSRHNRAITEQDYQELGGVARSLTQRADCEYEQLVKRDTAYAHTIRHVMLRMVAVGGGELARRRVSLSELEYPSGENERVQEVIHHFTDARLLVKGEDIDGNPYVEPAHDALVRGWQKLLVWKQEDEESLILQRRLTPAAMEWRTIDSKIQPSVLLTKTKPLFDWLDQSLYFGENLFNKINAQVVRLWWKQKQQESVKRKPVQFLWDTNPYLDVLNEQLKSSHNWFNQLETEFLHCSLQRRRNNRRRLISSVTGVILTLSGLTIFAFIQQGIADIRRLNAEINTQSLTAENLLISNLELEALIQALRIGQKIKQESKFLEWDTRMLGLSTLQQVVYGVSEHNRLEGTTIAFSPDGKTIATGNQDGSVKLWNLQGQTIKTFREHSGFVESIAFSPDGNTIASGSEDGTVKLWNLQSGASQTLLGHRNWVRSVAFSPDGNTIASGSRDKTVRLWNLQSGASQTFKGHSFEVTSIAFSPDGNTIASGSLDKTVRLWNLQGKPIKTLPGHSGFIWSVAFSPDGNTIASGSEDGTVKLWNLQSGASQTLSEDSSSIWSVAFSPDGNTIAVGSGKINSLSSLDRVIHIWNLQGQPKPIKILSRHNSSVISVAFSPNGNTIASGSSDGTVKLWNLQGQPIKVLQGHTGFIESLVFSPGGKTISIGSNERTGTVRLWNLQSGASKTLQGHSSAFSPDGKTIATASSDSTVKLWNLQSGASQTLTGHSLRVTSVAFSPDGNTFAAGSEDGTVKLWNLQSGASQTLTGHSLRVTSVAFSPDGNTFAAGSLDKTVRLWNLQGKPKSIKTFQHYVESLAFSPDSNTIATASSDSTVKLWNLQSGASKTLQGHSSAFSPDSNTIATASSDNTVKLWNLQSGASKTLQGHSDWVWSVAFSPDGNTIATASSDSTVKLWNLQGQLIKTLQGHSSVVTRVAFSPDGKTIAAGSWDGTVKLWNFDLDDLLARGCDWVSDYLKNNPNVEESDRHLCDDVPKPVTQDKSS
ncbi:caspase family protein [Nostoc sp. FACHB-152]|uniref:nSTAND1 domain-containing NTPase n=1 Tax=unclassified Nostoc TaxID=2593658 RepID=UPI00168734C0|nr:MULTISPECIES: caspase family protein [unclassified Nostoc]MBD2451653.1 caspase family protein [Nostoc sp. FACHB-152]MBD2472763.1 caspase family protein [Nostoc sp. FACHB-145]